MHPFRLAAVLAATVLFVPMHSQAASPMTVTLSTRTTLNLATAKAIVAAAEAEAQRQQLRVTIVVVDDAGRPLLLQRMDGTPNSSVEVATAKARHAVDYRRDTVFHQDLLEKQALAVLALPDSLPIEGGVMLKHGEEVIGAIGVSGAASSKDGEIARAGAAVLATARAP
ncbi:heme-binding protein [Lysobacter sp. LF1]|uniref:Heme-binding protein n=1 Tax=Lysobacter stagni TaxID=3045172 RepID=A0ABT6XBK0_9GAMM|nr:heme-binding protein [Lysobacter sp. LF1]MDI9237394.1 heme-binding protein [Lysobacter sp. LF1]